MARLSVAVMQLSIAAAVGGPSLPLLSRGAELFRVELPIAAVAPPFLRATATSCWQRWLRGASTLGTLLEGPLGMRTESLVRHHHGETFLQLPLTPHLLFLENPVVVVDTADGIAQKFLRCTRKHFDGDAQFQTKHSTLLLPVITVQPYSR